MIYKKLGYAPVKQTEQFTVLFDRKQKQMLAWITGLAFAAVLFLYALVRSVWP